MKRRLIKKWIKRYITPYIMDLPKTECGGFIIEAQGTGLDTYCSRSHMIVNGEVIPEGNMRRYRNRHNLRLNMKWTGEMAGMIRSAYDHVYLRTIPQVRGNDVRIRLITE